MQERTSSTDVVVIGGGLAGVSAAVAAARLGSSVALITNRPVLGGNSSSEVRVWVVGATAHGTQRFSRETGIMGELFLENQYRNAEGNPLALVELVAALRSTPDADPMAASSELPLTDRLEDAFANRITSLSPGTRSFLRVAAANDSGALAELLAAATQIEGHPVSLAAANEAREAGLVEVDLHGMLHFRHPLMRSAILRAMTLEQRRKTHAALAAALVPAAAARAVNVAHWTFDVANDKRVYPDTVGNNHPATPENKATVTAYKGEAPFDGAVTLSGQAGAYFNTPYIATLQRTSFTVAVWVNLSARAPNFILADWNKPDYSYMFGIDQPRNQQRQLPTVELRSSKIPQAEIDNKQNRRLTAVVRAQPNKDIPLNEWHHLAWVWTRTDISHGTMKIYLDGVQIGSHAILVQDQVPSPPQWHVLHPSTDGATEPGVEHEPPGIALDGLHPSSVQENFPSGPQVQVLQPSSASAVSPGVQPGVHSIAGNSTRNRLPTPNSLWTVNLP